MFYDQEESDNEAAACAQMRHDGCPSLPALLPPDPRFNCADPLTEELPF